MGRHVTTARAVVDALGGNEAVCELTGAGIKSVYYWKGGAKRFPARHFKMMQDALKKRRVTAPASLWNQAER